MSVQPTARAAADTRCRSGALVYATFMAQLTDKARSLLERKTFAMLGLVTDDGVAQVTPIWVDVEGDNPVFNTAAGRPKHAFMTRDNRVTLTLWDHRNPYSYTELRGTVEMSTGDEAEAMIDTLAHKYVGTDYPYRQDGEQRVRCVMTVDRTLGM